MRGIDSNGNGSDNGNGLLQFFLVTLWNVDESNVIGTRVAWIVPASVLVSLVWVAVLGVDALVLLDVLECVVHETTVAPVIAVLSGTVDQVLLAQGYQLAGLSEVLALQCSSL